ncbi:2,4,5-trihydroxytoluene oxygenase [Marinobacterium aestuariivivens]|uniref:2,4,5-trihydroxytoluene oxygenase n=1 Tax=Marinobacterium aestuariivivens TaxID=1698799 RepID=A0ABW2A5U6_9GAMM
MLRIKDINHVVYRHADLDAVERFLSDFGMVTAHKNAERLYMRGTGPLPYIYVAEYSAQPGFSTLAFAVEERDDLAFAQTLPGASPIEPIDGPGGGERVVLTDPAGLRVELIHGVEAVEPLPMREALTLNSAQDKQRFGAVQRPVKEPAQVMRLGHIAIGVTDMQDSLSWYREMLGLIPSDLVVESDDQEPPVAAFLRLNRGPDWTDHHTVALFQAPRDKVHHASFEVQDFDAQCLGNAWMAEHNWTPFWGIGRHLLGSQIFDYWLDPSGNIIEHFTDGDLFNHESPMGHTAACDASLYQWGPSMSVEDFLGEVSEYSLNKG